MSPFPIHRPRRLRANPSIRSLVRETELSTLDLVAPLFVTHGKQKREAINSMPGVFRFSIDHLAKEVQEMSQLGIPAVILFGIPETKDFLGSSGYSEKSVVCQAIDVIKKTAPQMVVIADVCLCEYTDHGHCGVLRPPPDPLLCNEGEKEEKNNPLSLQRRGLGRGLIDNDSTLELLSKMSGVYARAGADIIAPSDMMDGRVQAIRDELDAAGYKETPILSYAVKYASAFYGPFREAVGSTPQFGDRRSYQMDPANIREAIREAALDLEEGADILMVKPALPCLDVIKTLRDQFQTPLAAYQVSGEYSMIKAAAKMGFIDEKQVVLESLTAIKRAGADFILTYFAKDVAGWLRG